MQSNNLYECPVMHDTLGDTLRPGGLEITKRALEYCNFNEDDMLLDLGCGKGATIKYLHDSYNIHAKGLDISKSLAEQAKKTNENSEIVISSGENIPFENHLFDGVLAECTLSLMANLEQVIDEVYRILKPKGYFIISDIYAKESGFLEEMNSFSLNTCLRNPHNLENLKNLLTDKGFHILLEEKHDKYIKQLIFKIIFQHESMDNFWNASSGDACSFSDRQKFQESLKKSKLGYFLLITGKEK
ncbi:MAG TPA: class I SAM-dependent methyltransferase [Sedimentibacter sp.]|nr:class I SAM-dependent methyltransferase [Sedimentibacter sp.]